MEMDQARRMGTGTGSVRMGASPRYTTTTLILTHRAYLIYQVAAPAATLVLVPGHPQADPSKPDRPLAPQLACETIPASGVTAPHTSWTSTKKTKITTRRR